MGGLNLPGLLYLVILLGVVFLPMVLGRGGSSPGQSDSDSDDGGGGGPRPPRTPPRPRGAAFHWTGRSPAECD